MPYGVCANGKSTFLEAIAEMLDGYAQRTPADTLKQMTGSKKIMDRFMRAEFFEFAPMFKLWIGTNHRPVIRGTDQAIWRRIKLISFNVTIPPEERDKDLPNKLRKELLGILNWAVMGCVDWLQYGLGEPEEVTKATDEYRSEMDVIKRFVSDCCTTNTERSTKPSEFYKKYSEWSKDNNEFALSQTKFSTRMQEKGFSKCLDCECSKRRKTN